MRRICTFALLCSAISVSQASTLFVGSNSAGPVQRYTTSGVNMGSFGSADGTGSAVDGQGSAYIVEPGENSSLITIFDSFQTPLSSIVFNGGIDNGNGSPGHITDMAYGGGGTLWVSGFNGIVYHISAAGSVLSSFDTGSLFTGIATDGTHLYTSQGLDGGAVYQRSADGTIVNTIFTGLFESLGVGFNTDDGTLWVGGTDTVTNVAMSGAVLATLSVPGFHDALEVGDIGSADVVPEPSTLLISGLGLA